MNTVSFSLYVGVDWGNENHQVCVVDPERRILGEKSFEHSGAGLARLVDWLLTFSNGVAERTAIAIEVPRGAVVETLLERGFSVFSINPKQLDRFRDRHTVAGAKDDRRDAFVLADSLRTDEPCFHSLRLDDAVTIQLRELTRVDDHLRIELGRLSNRLREQLHRFFPQMLQLSGAANEPFLWDLIELIPEPAVAARMKPKRVEKLLQKRRIRRWSAKEVLDVLRAPAIYVAPGTVEACRAHIQLLLPMLRLVQENRKTCAKQISKLLEQLPPAPSEQGQQREHRDADIFLSLPGAGKVVTATVLAEASQPLAERDYHAIRSQAGSAPVTRATGKRSKKLAYVSMRRACNPRLRWIMYNWGRVAVQKDEQLRARYKSMRSRGHTHGRALRGIADRLLRMLIAMLRDGTLYDPARLHGPGLLPAPRALD